MSAHKTRPPRLPEPGEAYRGASGGVRVVVAAARMVLPLNDEPARYVDEPARYVDDDDGFASHVAWKAEGCGPRIYSTVLAWRLWQRSATRVASS